MNLLSRFTNGTRFRDYNDFYNHFSLNVPDNFNYAYDVVDEYARLEPGKRALVWCDDAENERIFTFADIKRISDQAANFFLSCGIGKGDTVLVILQRRHEYWTTLMALSKIGAVAIPATHMLMKKDLVYRMEKAHVKMVVSVNEDELCDNIRKAMKEVPCVQHAATIGKREGFIDYTEAVEKQSEELDIPFRSERSADDLLLLYFTSGTTGMPKMVTLPQRYTLGHIVTARYWLNCMDDGLHFTLAETGWAKASWGKLFGQWLCGSAIFVYDFHGKFDPSALMEHIARYKITTFCAPPTVYRFMIKSDMSKYDLSSIKYMMTAGEALNPEIYRQIRMKTG
ncbi:MAG TPA: AMP-binding protein, partial [Candidatus Borkfalkia faecigallinarum]|nr:AMP-binding protein [Candidatus Borkfalkia faecigallinarum]